MKKLFKSFMSRKQRFVRARNLETDRLDSQGFEKLDPIPRAVEIGVRPVDSLEERINSMLRDRHYKANPDWGLDSDDPNDFEMSSSDDPMYAFERQYEEIEKLREELTKAEKEYSDEKERYRKERIEANKNALLAASKKDPAGTPAGSKPKAPEPSGDE